MNGFQYQITGRIYSIYITALKYFLFMKTTVKTRLPDKLQDSRRYNTMCVCQICTCGNHRCPPAGHKPFTGETTYNRDYKPCSGIVMEMNKPCTNHYHERHYDPALLKTTYDAQYVPHQIENQPITPSKYDYRPRSGKFYDQTEYNKNYQPKEVPIERPKDCCHLYTPKRGKFEGTTTYNAQFSPKKAENAFTPPNYNYERRKVPFEGKTTYNTEYKPHQIEPTWKGGCCSGCPSGCSNGCKCNSGCGCSYTPKRTGKFQGESNYKANYKPYEIERNQHCPILDLPQYPRECSPGKTHLNYSAEKNKWY